MSEDEIEDLAATAAYLLVFSEDCEGNSRVLGNVPAKDVATLCHWVLRTLDRREWGIEQEPTFTFCCTEGQLVRQALGHLRGLVDSLGPCNHFDSNGYCQAHFVESPCRVGKAREFLESLPNNAACVKGPTP